MLLQAVADTFHIKVKASDEWFANTMQKIYELRGIEQRMTDIKFQLREAFDDLQREKINIQYERDRFQALSEAIDSGILIYRGREVIVVNKMLQHWLGYSEEQLIANPDLLNTCFNESDFRIVMQHKLKNDTSPYQISIINKNGLKRKVVFHPKMVNYNGQGLCRAVYITEYKERK